MKKTLSPNIVEIRSQAIPERKEFLELLKGRYSDSDPRSINYQRVLIKPEIKWKRMGINIAIFLLVNLSLIFFMHRDDHNMIFLLILNIAYIAIRSQNICVSIIQVYQRIAPDSIRNKCRFEPSCSEYMVLAIKKYGTLKGITLGIKRLRRCNSNNGGYDNIP